MTIIKRNISLSPPDPTTKQAGRTDGRIGGQDY